jgi:hypothetical protein
VLGELRTEFVNERLSNSRRINIMKLRKILDARGKQRLTTVVAQIILLTLVLGMFHTTVLAALPHVFNDGFESGDLSNWTTVNGLVVQQDEVYAGEYAVRGTSTTGTPAYASKQLSETYNELYYRLWFKVISQGEANQIVLQRFRTATNVAIMGVFVGQTGKLSLRNDVANINVASTTTVTEGVWHQLQVRIVINGASGQSEVWLDGVRIDALSITQDFGTNPVGYIQLGESSALRIFDIALDRVAVDTEFIDPADPPEVVTPPTSVTVDVWTGVTQQDPITLEHDQATRVNYPGVNDGPVELSSTTADPIVGSEALIYSVNGTAVSFSESMGLPESQMDNNYWLPWYNNVGLDTQLRIANVTSQTANVQLFIGGNEITNCTPIPSQPYPYELSEGESVRVSCVGVNDGPVRIQSNVDIVAAERIIYKVNNASTSFTEMMALPESQLDDTYWLPWYNNVGLDTQLRIANVTSQTTTVKLFIGVDEVSNCTTIPNMPYPYELGEGESVRVSCAGVNNGPMRVQSDNNVKIVVAERVIYKVNGVNTSFAELMGLPDLQLDNTYWLPWYDNVGMDTQLRFGNVSNATATVKVFIAGVEMTTGCTPIPAMPYPYELDPGESIRVSCASNTGPVEIVSTQDIVAAERVIYKANGINTSFTEMMAMPAGQLDTTFWMPWYNNVGLFSELRLGVP